MLGKKREKTRQKNLHLWSQPIDVLPNSMLRCNYLSPTPPPQLKETAIPMRGNIGVGEAEEVCLIKYQTNETGLFFCLNFSFVRQHNLFLCLNQVPSILGFFFRWWDRSSSSGFTFGSASSTLWWELTMGNTVIMWNYVNESMAGPGTHRSYSLKTGPCKTHYHPMEGCCALPALVKPITTQWKGVVPCRPL